MDVAAYKSEDLGPGAAKVDAGDGYTHHVLQVGQSNAGGADAYPPVSTTPLAGLSMLTPLAAVAGSNGIRAPQERLVSAAEYTSLVAMAESQTTDNIKNIDGAGHFTGVATTYGFGETALTSMLLDLRNKYHAIFAGVGSSCGVADCSYTKLKKGTDPYANGITQIRAVRDLASPTPSRVYAVTVQHGEADAANASYAANLIEWLTDWTADIRAEIPGQTRDPVMIATQLSTLAFGSKVSALQIFAAMLANPRFLVATPCYAVPGGINGHRTPIGQRQQGAYLAKVYQRVVIEGGTWAPLYPLSAVRAGAVVTVTFNVPLAPLVFDTPPGGSLLGPRGFEFVDDSASATASSAAIVGNTVQVTLSGVPTGANKRIKYAVAGTFGNLRDSDAQVSSAGDPLFNWCLHFDLAAT